MVGRVVEVGVVAAAVVVLVAGPVEHARPPPDESHSPGVERALQAGARRLQVRMTHQLRDWPREGLPPDMLLSLLLVLGDVVVADVGGVAEIGRLVQGGASTQLVGLG